MMKKLRRYISIVCLIGVLFVSFIPYSFAINNLPDVQSPLPEPSVFYGIENGKKKLVVNFVLYNYRNYDGGLYRLVNLTCFSSSDSDFYVMFNPYSPSITCTKTFTYNRIVYDIQSGSIIEDISGSSTLGSSDQWALCYPPDHLNYVGATMDVGGYFQFYPIIPDNVSSGPNSRNQSYDSSLTNEFVIWSVIPPEPVIYKSFTSEPISDPLNRYYIVAGEEYQYLYWFNLRIAQFDVMRSKVSSDEDPYFIYNYITQNNAYQPSIEYDSSGVPTLYIKANQDYIDFLLLYDGAGIFFDYDILITKYDLESGKYIASELHQDISGGTDKIHINSNLFDNLSNYDSLQCFDINFRNDSSYMINRLACTWGFDPDFEVWKDSILSRLDDIYNVLSGSEDTPTYPTEPALESAVDQYHSAESQLMVDYGADLGNALSSGSGAASSNGAMSFIKGAIQSLVLDNNKLSIFIMFALSFGLIVLVLGRRITR